MEMNALLLAVLYGAMAGLAIPLGAYAARIERLQPEWLETEFRHSVIAFGGGVLVAAVALVLVPEGMRSLPPSLAVGAFVAGGILFAVIEWLQLRHGSAYEQMLAMLADFLPEALALGALIASDGGQALLLAVLIAVQNFPEAFNAWREVRSQASFSAAHTMRMFILLALIGPIAGLIGATALAGQTVLTGIIMLSAAGGILFLMFQAIAVKAHLENRQAPALAAVAGFAVGIVCHAAII